MKNSLPFLPSVLSSVPALQRRKKKKERLQLARDRGAQSLHRTSRRTEDDGSTVGERERGAPRGEKGARRTLIVEYTYEVQYEGVYMEGGKGNPPPSAASDDVLVVSHLPPSSKKLKTSRVTELEQDEQPSSAGAGSNASTQYETPTGTRPHPPLFSVAAAPDQQDVGDTPASAGTIGGARVKDEEAGGEEEGGGSGGGGCC